ncbi:MAG: hypothetical protein QW688_03125, partial [Thermoprotei archaeon]
EEDRAKVTNGFHEIVPPSVRVGDLRATLSEFLGKTVAGVVLNYVFPLGIRGDTLTEEEFRRFKGELRELLGTQAELIVNVLT